MWQDVGILFAVSLVFFLLAFLVADKNILLSKPIGDSIGKISYSLHLLHRPVLFQLEKPVSGQSEIFLMIFLVVSIIISYMSYLIIQNPSRKAIRSISYSKRVHSGAQGAELKLIDN
jgi:peptidoglycan/LPS O-acetylase OafA/YrhL